MRRSWVLVGLLLGGACFHDSASETGEGATATATTTTTTDASATTTTATDASSGVTTSTTTTTTTTATATATTATTATTSTTADTTASTTLRPPADLGVADLGGPPAVCPQAPELRACYTFDAGWDLQLLVDEVGGHDGDLVGATPIDGVHGLAAQTSLDTAISVPAANTPVGGAPWTVMAWVRVDLAPSPSRAGVFDRDGDYGIFITAARTVRCGGLHGAEILPLGVWSHVACIWHPDRLEIVVNGALDAAVVVNDTASPVGQPLVIGNNSPPSADEALVGAVDEIMLWAAILSPAEICAAAGLEC